MQKVRPTAEFRRIKALPRRTTYPADIVERYTDMFKGRFPIWEIQARSLYDADSDDGLGMVGLLDVGDGKTLTSLLLPAVMKSKCAVLMVPAALKEKTLDEFKNFYLKNFETPVVPHVITYHQLSSQKQAEILNQLKPDLIIADEAHNLANKMSARTKRFLRYMKENEQTRFCPLSATLTTKSLFEYAHLIELTLRNRSPVPRIYSDIADWADVLDAETSGFTLPGVLEEFCENGESVRRGYQRRLNETLGIVSSGTSKVNCSIYVNREEIKVPMTIKHRIKQLEKEWQIHDVEINSALEMAKYKKTLSMGFYYKFDWPNGIVDREWLRARNEWAKVTRNVLKYRSKPGLDSVKFVARAASLDQLRPDEQATWYQWCGVKDRPVPPTVAVWMSDYLVKLIEKTLPTLDRPTIIWYQWRALEGKLNQFGIPVFGTGTNPSHCTDPIIFCSMNAQSEGKNLQFYNHNILTSFPSNAKLLQQIMGRTHRSGQKADEVTFDWWSYGEISHKTYHAARRQADYREETLGYSRQKINLATKLNEPTE